MHVLLVLVFPEKEERIKKLNRLNRAIQPHVFVFLKEKEKRFRVLDHSYQTLYFFYQFGSKKPTFAQIAKALLHQTPYFNFTIPYFNISLLFYFIFSQLPKYYTTKKHYYTKKISSLFPQLMNSGSLI